MRVSLKSNIDGLRVDSQAISLEALSYHMTTKPLIDKLVQFGDSVSEFITEKTSAILSRSDKVAFALSGSPSAHLKKVPYLQLKDVLLPCPEGLKVSFLTYASIIEDAQKITGHLMENCLYPFSAFVSEALNDPKKLESNLRKANIKNGDLDPIRKRLTSAFDGSNAEIPYVVAFARNADWDELEKVMVKINATQQKTDDKVIADKIKNIQSNLSRLIEAIQNPAGGYVPSPGLVAELSKITYTLAEQVTFYSIIATSVESLNVALEASKKVIKAAAKE